MKQKILVTGANGMLANDLISMLMEYDYRVYPFDKKDLDITSPDSVYKTIHSVQPDIIINCSAYTKVDLCETEKELAFQVNRDGVSYLVKECKNRNLKFIHISTDYVFDGIKKSPYTEYDQTNPQTIYGLSKLRGEIEIQNNLENYIIIRTAWLYGLSGQNFVKTIIRLSQEKKELRIVSDQIGTPTYTKHLSYGIFSLIEAEAIGIFHFTDDGQCSWYDFACEIVEQMEENSLPVMVNKIYPITTSEYPTQSKRPLYSVLNKEKYMNLTGNTLSHWKDSLKLFFNSYKSISN